MKSTRIPGCIAVLACTLGSLPAAQATTHYHFVDLGGQARAVNAKGEVAGQAPDGGPGLYADGTWKSKPDHHHYGVAYGIDAAGNMIGEVHRGKHDGRILELMYYPHGQKKGVDIPLPNGSTSGDAVYNDVSPGGISPDGLHVVGTFVDAVARISHCFVWTPGAATSMDIGLPAGFDACDAEGVNDAGEIVGQLWSEASGFSAFTYGADGFHLVGPTGIGGSADLSAINAAGHATGYIGGLAAFWNGKTLSAIPASGGLQMGSGTAINKHDVIVGWGSNATSSTTLIYSGGVLRDLVPMIDDTTGWSFAFGGSAMGINDDGTIVGLAFHDNGNGTSSERGYMLVPLD